MLRFESDDVVFLSREIIFAAAGVLLEVSIFLDIPFQQELGSEARQVAKDVSVAQEARIDIFEQIESFFDAWRLIRDLSKRHDNGHRGEDDGQGTEPPGYCVEDKQLSF